MGKSSSVLICICFAGLLAGCHTASRAAAPPPESQQVISGEMKNLYMAASAAGPGSPQQQDLIVQMAGKASNGKELLLVMRASVGVFPAAGAATEAQVRSTVTARMMQVATLNQLADFASQYGVEPVSARRFVERMFELGGSDRDPRTWHRIRLAATRLKVPDLEQAARVRAAEPAR